MWIKDFYNRAKPIVLTTFFGLGKLISIIGSNVFAIDKFFTRYNLDNTPLLLDSVKVLSAISAGLPIAATRIPEMYKQFSAQPTSTPSQENITFNKKAKAISYLFGSLSLIAAGFNGMSAYLNGNTIANNLKIYGAIAKTVGSYVAISSVVSFIIYTSLKVINNTYDVGLMIFDREKRKNLKIGKLEFLTLGLSSISVISSGTMYYFSIKHSLSLILSDLDIDRLSGEQLKIIASVSIIPSEMTFIFSQIAEANKYFKETDNIFLLRPNGLKNNLLYIGSMSFNMLSVLIRGMIFYEYMADLLDDFNVPGAVVIVLSILNALSSAFIYYTFTARPALINTIKLLKNKEQTDTTRSVSINLSDSESQMETHNNKSLSTYVKNSITSCVSFWGGSANNRSVNNLGSNLILPNELTPFFAPAA